MNNDANELLRRRLDAIQRDIREIRLRDEQREAIEQTLVRTLTIQMVELASEVDEKLRTMSERLDGMLERLDGIEERLDQILQILQGTRP
jgi:DNA repair exonuclease SbcCD ATPase subunit